MQETIIILGAVSLLDAISEEVVMFCLNSHKGYKKINKNIINRKPFNCEKCLGFWLGIIIGLTVASLMMLLTVKKRLSISPFKFN